MRQAKRHGIEPRPGHTWAAKRAALMAARYPQAQQFKRMRHEIKRLKTYLGRVYRDICRKIAGNTGLLARFARLLGLVHRLLAQQTKDKNKPYAPHAPKVVCIAKAEPWSRHWSEGPMA